MVAQLQENLKSVLFSKPIRKLTDVIMLPLTGLAAIWMRYIRSRNINEMPVSKRILMSIGVFPINDHYFEPLFNTRKYLKRPLDTVRPLPGMEFNTEEQVQLLCSFHYGQELLSFPMYSETPLTYYYKNGSYPSGDAELLYSMIRHFQPERIIEVGCGYSTLMIRNALAKNLDEFGSECVHECVEPFEMKWLERLNIPVKREKVEDLDPNYFSQLQHNDILFIDSTHMIKPQGDVLFEILEILPILNPGVIVHFHDIFTPRDYPAEWVSGLNRFWNEQYLLEAFLSHNKDFKVLLAANYMRHLHPEIFFSACPIVDKEVLKEPGSLWIQKVH